MVICVVAGHTLFIIITFHLGSEFPYHTLIQEISPYYIITTSIFHIHSGVFKYIVFGLFLLFPNSQGLDRNQLCQNHARLIRFGAIGWCARQGPLLGGSLPLWSPMDLFSDPWCRSGIRWPTWPNSPTLEDSSQMTWEWEIWISILISSIMRGKLNWRGFYSLLLLITHGFATVFTIKNRI